MLLSPLTVMLLAIDAMAGFILHRFNLRPFVAIQATAIGPTARFIAGDMGLVPFEASGFTGRQAAIVDAARDAVLLVILAVIDP